LCCRAWRGHRNARAVAGRPIYDRHRAQPLECRRGHVGISCYGAYCAAAGLVVGATDRTSILARGRSRGEGQRGGTVEDGRTGVDLDGERARIVTLGGEEADEIGDAAPI